MTLLPRCTHVFGYCAKTKPPQGNLTDRQDKHENYRSTPNCKLDFRTCEHYRILVPMYAPLGQWSHAQTLQTPST